MEELFKEHNQILRQIAEGLDALVMGQESMVQILDELVDVAEDLKADLEPPVTAKGEYELPGFGADPLKDFPSIRKEGK